MNKFDNAVAAAALFMGMVIGGGICMAVLLLVSIFVDIPLLSAFLLVAIVSVSVGLGVGIRVANAQKKAGR